VTGANYYDFLAPEDRERYREFHERVCRGEKGFLEYTIITLQGERRRMETNAAPMSQPDGTVVLLGVSRDVTERRKAEERLGRSEAFLAEAQRLSLTGSFAWQPETDQITWSDQVYRIFELDPAEPVTFERIRTRIHPDDLPLFARVVDRARADGEGFEYELRLLMPDRSGKYLHVVAHAARDAGGGLEFLGAVQDVTERQRSQEALDRAREELTRVARASSLGTLTASIAHEVNQPLSGVVTNASTGLRMLAAEPPNIEGARETLRRTIRDGHRASEVVTRLRGLFAGKEMAGGPVDLNDAAREVLALTEGTLRRGRVVVRDELADALPAVPGDRVQLQQVILNLLLNAADAMSAVEDRPRQVVVRTAREGDGGVLLSVEDTGVGFAPEDAERLFESFYTTKGQGMGIGLSVSRSIIARHRGRLWAARNEGPGATFAFTIPATADTKV
jgi:PAS domain S-box-containing protein